MNMLSALTILFLYQLVGEALVYLLHLPVPGPVIGMALLFFTLLWRGLAAPLKETSHSMLQHLSLLFVPAGVGVMVHFNRIASEWLPITAALLVSTVLTLLVTAWVICIWQRKSNVNP